MTAAIDIPANTANSGTINDTRPLIAAFAKEFREQFDPDRLQSFWACEALLRRLATSSFAQNVVNDMLHRLAADPQHVGDWQPKQLMLHRGRGFALSLALFDAPRRYIHTTPFFAMYVPVSGIALVSDRYRLPADHDNAVFDPAQKLERAGSFETAASEVLRLESNRYAYDFRVEAPLLVLKLTTAPFQMLEWLFSKENLQAWQANDTDLGSTQLRVAAYLLGRLAHQSSLDPLKALSGHANPNVRWAAIQSLGRLNRKEALKRLHEALDDPHPHIRRAAKKSIDRATDKTGSR